MTTDGYETVSSRDGTPIGFRTLGRGPDVVVVGGALSSGDDYMELARSLAPQFRVHVVDRRGRGRSGPLGPAYSIERECEDLDAVLATTGASRVLGHSYGGLVALEAARRGAAITRLALYEPGVHTGASFSDGWLEAYRRRLEHGDRRGAFAEFVRGSGGAPPILARMPVAYVKLVLRIAIPAERWRRIEPLLEANLREHEEVLRLADGIPSYGSVSAQVLVLAGAKTRRSLTAPLVDLANVIPAAELELLPGLGHDAPEHGAPPALTDRILGFMVGAS